MGEARDSELRKTDIMDCAMKLFAERGFEKTTMADIAEKLNMSVEECCQYFKSKQSLYEETLKAYVDSCSEDIINVFKSNVDIKDCIRILRNSADKIKAKFKYSDFFDKNEKFHEQLEYAMTEKIALYAVEYLKMLKEKGKIHIDDPVLTAKFILRSEMAVFNDEKFAGDIHLAQNKILKKLYSK